MTWKYSKRENGNERVPEVKRMRWATGENGAFEVILFGR